MKTLFACASTLAVALVACGGDTVVADDGATSEGTGGSGAAGAAGGSSNSAGGTSNSSSSGAGACSAHSDCPPGQVCLFSSGLCTSACEGDLCSACDPGTFCDGCATSSCPEGADCRPACILTPAAFCDDNDPCNEGAVCIWEQHLCAAACTPDGGCSDPGYFCGGCVTSSCCGCKDCVSACQPGD